MISSQIVLKPLDQITVLQDRRTLNETTVLELAQSIRTRGLIHTILIDPKGVLAAGGHRLAAFKHLFEIRAHCPYPELEGWNRIPTREAFDVTEAELKALEIEENIKRSDPSWDEIAKGVQQYHALKIAAASDWTMSDTAEALGMSSGSASRYLIIAGELEKGNERVAKAGTLTAAYNIIARSNDRAIAAEMETLEVIHTENHVPEASKQARGESIFCEDFLKWIETYKGQKFNLIHCDFPYGINHQESEQGRASNWGEYDDRPEVFWTLTRALLRNLDKIAYKSAHIMFWFSMNFYEDILHEIYESNADLSIDLFPLIWHKSDNKGLLPDPERGPRRIYETCLLISRGDRKVVQAVSNLYSAPTTKEIHLSEKPESVLRYFMRMLVDEHTELLDPTCGSGTALRAAEALGAHRVLGLELNPEFAMDARGALDRARKIQNLAAEVKP